MAARRPDRAPSRPSSVARPTTPAARPGRGATPASNATDAWIEAFKKTHGGLTPEQYNAQYATYKPAYESWSKMVADPSLRPMVSPAPVAPFQTGDDMLALADREGAIGEALAAIDKQLADLSAQTTYNLNQVDESAAKATSGSKDQSAGRGLSGSTIAQAELFDIEATARTRKSFLQSELARAGTQAGLDKERLRGNLDAIRGAIGRKMVENAEGISRTQQPTPGPLPPPPAPPPGPAPAQGQIAGQPGSGDPNYPFLQTTGSRAGKKYQVKIVGNKRYKVYPGEQPIPF